MGSRLRLGMEVISSGHKYMNVIDELTFKLLLTPGSVDALASVAICSSPLSERVCSTETTAVVG